MTVYSPTYMFDLPSDFKQKKKFSQHSKSREGFCKRFRLWDTVLKVVISGLTFHMAALCFL